MTGPMPLPEFERPPLVETVLSAQFEPILGFRTVHFGLFWARVRDEFPHSEDKPAIAAAFERFVEIPARAPRVRFEAREGMGPERSWFVNRARTEMIQVQADRFVKNWQKEAMEATYPRYEKAIRPGFDKHFELFQKFLDEEKLPPIKLNQYEVSYVNQIVAGEGFRSLSEARTVFPLLGSLPDGVEDAGFLFRLPIQVEGKSIGRLNVEMQPAYRETDQKPMFVLQLTARGFAGGGLDFFDLGREAIVREFAKLTSPQMHEVWGRKDQRP